MIRLRQLVEEILKEAGRTSRFWWLSPDSEFHEVTAFGHDRWAAEYLKKHHGIVDADEKDTYAIMSSLGWIRVGFTGYMGQYLMEFNYASKDGVTTSQIRALRDKAIELGADELKDLTKGRTIELQEIRLEPPTNTRPLKAVMTSPTVRESDEVPPEEKPMYRGRKTYGRKLTYDELMQATTPKRKEKAQHHVRTRSIPVSVDDEGHEQWNFRYRSDRLTGDPGDPYQGRVTFLKGEVGKDDSAKDLQCEVDCECNDYMYRFAYNNAEHGAGQVGPDTLSGVINRKPKPAYDYGIGLCKHLTALARYLHTKIKAVSPRQSNLFEAVSDVARQGPFTVTYYDD